MRRSYSLGGLLSLPTITEEFRDLQVFFTEAGTNSRAATTAMRRHFDHFLPFQEEENPGKDEQRAENDATEYSQHNNNREIHKPPDAHDQQAETHQAHGENRAILARSPLVL